jgi:hypothetical protein
LGHRAPHASQGLGAAGLGHTLRSPFNIGPCDGAAGSRSLDALKINIELARERAHGWKYLRLLPDRSL